MSEIVYMAHPVAGDVPGNVSRAKQWLRALQDEYPDKCFIAPWITDVEIYDDSNPAMRDAGLDRCKVVIARCDALVSVVEHGNERSEGMVLEEVQALRSGLKLYWVEEITYCKMMETHRYE